MDFNESHSPEEVLSFNIIGKHFMAMRFSFAGKGRAVLGICRLITKFRKKSQCRRR